jgi:hypothetical protein
VFLLIDFAEGGAERLPFAGSRWTVSVICFHVALMLVWFL